MINVIIDPDLLYYPKHQDKLLQSALWYDQILISQLQSIHLTSGRLSLSYEKGTILGDLYGNSILDVIPDPLQDILPINDVMSLYLKENGFKENDFKKLISFEQKDVTVKRNVLTFYFMGFIIKVLPYSLSPTWKDDLMKCKIPKGFVVLPTLNSEEESVKFYDWFNEETGLSKLREIFGINEPSLVLDDGKIYRQPYYVHRDVSFVLTILFKNLPILLDANQGSERSSYFSKLLEDVFNNSQIFKRRPNIEKHEIIRDLIVPRINLSNIGDVVKWRKDPRFVDLRGVIGDITSKSPDNLDDPNFTKNVMKELSLHFMEEITKKASIKKISLKAIGIEIAGLVLSALTGLPLPVGSTTTILEKWKEKIERDKKWYNLLWSFRDNKTR
jgi:hypothetical protein